MPKKTEFPEAIRISIVADHKAGKSIRAIARDCNISFEGVRKILKKMEMYGTVKNLHRSGRKRCTTAREDRVIKLQATVNPKVSVQIIKESTGTKASVSTVRRRLREAGLKGCVARRVPFISKVNMKKRVAFAKQHINKPNEFWVHIIWSDESKFELCGSKRRQIVWRRKNTAYNANHTVGTVKHSQYVMLWGCFSRAGLGNLEEISGKMNGSYYRDILQNNLRISARNMGLGNDFTFQHDNDPKHTSSIVKRFLENNNINVLQWPPQSPDLNPIEHLWDELDRKVPKSKRRSLKEYRAALFEEWVKIEPDILITLVDSMPQRLEAVIKANGGPTRY